MSKSVHRTLKSVFGGKSKAEIDRMFDEDDPDLLEYLRKLGIKRRVASMRQLEAVLEELDPEMKPRARR